MELIIKKFELLTENDIISDLTRVSDYGLTSPMYQYLLATLVTLSYNKNKIVENSTRNPYCFYDDYLGMYLYYAKQKENEELIEKLKEVIRKENITEDFYDTYLHDIPKYTVDYIDEVLYIVNLTKELKGEIFIIQYTLKWLIGTLSGEKFVEMFSKIEFNYKTKDVIDILVSYDEFYICDYEELLMFLIRFYISRNEITYNEIVEIIALQNNDYLDRWINNVKLDEV